MTLAEKALLDALGSLALSQNLEHDTIMIVLSIAGYEPHGMTQFERAGALIDMAHELAALTDSRIQSDSVFDVVFPRTDA
jgi:hypothetical protein